MALGVLSYLTGDLKGMVVIFVMVVLAWCCVFFQEMRADNAAEKLQSDGQQHGDVGARRQGTRSITQDVGAWRYHPVGQPAIWCRRMYGCFWRKDLFLNQAALTGEALPVEKKAAQASVDVQNPAGTSQHLLSGSNVESGSATAVVICTGNRTYFGSLAASIVGQRHSPALQGRQ